ncbi:hypothetical protein MUG91_G36n72 [Manis pentadactyla]|nr:hypothetical protein MUG91_G36n72 [Manis pentadactyla]
MLPVFGARLRSDNWKSQWVRPSVQPPFIVCIWRLRNARSLGLGCRRGAGRARRPCPGRLRTGAALCRYRYVWGVCGITLLPNGAEGQKLDRGGGDDDGVGGGRRTRDSRDATRPASPVRSLSAVRG